MLAPRRALQKSPVGISRRPQQSIWRPLAVSPTRRWLTTGSADQNDDHDFRQVRPRETATQKNKREFALLPTLLRVFETATGHRVVPLRFVIPSEDGASRAVKRPTRVYGLVDDVHKIPWPREAHGMNFGNALHKFATHDKHQHEHPTIAETLLAMGVELGEGYKQQAWDEQIMPALKTYYRRYGHTLVPSKFVVPRDDMEWPVATRGFYLGVRVQQLRKYQSEVSADQLADLQSVEFSFDVDETMWSDYILPALQVFVQFHGHCRVPSVFQVPCEQPWPRKAWGLNLGLAVSNLRRKPSYSAQVARDKAILESIGFVWNELDYRWSAIVLPSLEAYHQVYSHTLIPRSFAVPFEAPYPQEAWGYNLGRCVGQIRSTGRYAQHCKRDAVRLEAIDFVWDVRQHKWSTFILPALETFAHEFGHCNVPVAFVVPSESPWPMSSWGFRLGVVVHSMRSDLSYTAKVKQDAARLEAIGFVWDHLEDQWTHRVLPALETFYQIYNHIEVPDKFVVPSTSEWPKKAWGMKLRDTLSHIQLKGGYAKFAARDAERLAAIGFKVERPALQVDESK